MTLTNSLNQVEKKKQSWIFDRADEENPEIGRVMM